MDESNKRPVMLASAAGRQNLMTAPLLEVFYCNTRLRKSYIDKTTRTSEQIIKLFQANNKTPKEDLE